MSKQDTAQYAPTSHGFDQGQIVNFVSREYQVDACDTSIEVRPLRGGQEAAVVEVKAHIARSGKARGSVTFVVKRLEGGQRREALIYEMLLAPMGIPAPRLLGVEPGGPATLYLYLERVNPWRRWPWAERGYASMVLDELASLHSSSQAASAAREFSALWDYEAELQQSAHATLDLFERWVGREEFATSPWALAALRRMVDAIPAIRLQVRADDSPDVVIHGDPHPGNAMIRRNGAGGAGGASGGMEAVLLDWGRTRIGCAMEDVSCWLLSLGLWEPEAKRRHDTLLRRYLEARGLPTRLGSEFRERYWLAAACNALAGSLRYQLAVMDGWDSSKGSRVEARHAVQSYLRVIRRADACWRN
jgi:hypothetical protein